VRLARDGRCKATEAKLRVNEVVTVRGPAGPAGRAGTNGWFWRNYGNGFAPVGSWKDRGGVVHLEGVAELTSGTGGGQRAAFVLPPAYRPATIRRFAITTTSDFVRHVDVNPDGSVNPALGGAGTAPLDSISFRP